VGRRMHLFELLDRHLRINLRAGQAHVTQHLLDKPDIGPVLQHQGRHRMSEKMTGSLFEFQIRPLDITMNHLTQILGPKSLSIAAQKKNPFITKYRLLGTKRQTAPLRRIGKNGQGPWR